MTEVRRQKTERKSRHDDLVPVLDVPVLGVPDRLLPAPQLVAPDAARSGDPGPTVPRAREHGCRIAAFGGVRHDGKEGAPRCMGEILLWCPA
jgi:hypothetical protein